MWESGIKEKLAKYQQDLLLKKLVLSDLSRENNELSAKYKNICESKPVASKDQKFLIQHSLLEAESLRKNIKEKQDDINFVRTKHDQLKADLEKLIVLKKDLKENHIKLKVDLDELKQEKKQFKTGKTGWLTSGQTIDF